MHNMKLTLCETQLRQRSAFAAGARPAARKHVVIARPAYAQASGDSSLKVTRREAGLAAAGLALVATLGSPGVSQGAAAALSSPAPFQLPPLPYAIDALEPKGMSQRTLEFHHGKHHAAYVANLNNQVKGNSELEGLSLQEVMLKAWNGGKPMPAFNNAAQVVNHTFFWESMAPNGGGEPKGKLLDAIKRDFGSYDEFKKQFKTAGASQFGSGWAWLVVGKDSKLKVTKTANAENPWVFGETPLITCDVWEHAYYLDVQNRRPDYISGFLDGLVDWEAAARRYQRAA